MLISWTEIHLLCSGEQALAASDQLQLLGAKAITFKDAEDNPIYEPDPENIKLWKKTIVIGLFESEEITEDLLKELQSFGEPVLHKLENQDWVRLSLAQFKPMQFGNKLWICPTWIPTPDPQAINVILDPGLAFGTGKHPTTSLCLEWLANNLQNEKIIVDYGCGSGILGITAYMLGAEKIYAVDNDELALQATSANAKLNKISDTNLQTFLPREMPTIPADLLIANILAQPILGLKPRFIELIKPHGKILLSGILATQVEEVTKHYAEHFKLKDAIITEGWACLEGIRLD